MPARSSARFQALVFTCWTGLPRNVKRDTRIFPLLQLGATPSPHVLPVSKHFRAEGYKVAQVPVSYEFQRGGNQMLRIRKVD